MKNMSIIIIFFDSGLLVIFYSYKTIWRIFDITIFLAIIYFSFNSMLFFRSFTKRRAICRSGGFLFGLTFIEDESWFFKLSLNFFSHHRNIIVLCIGLYIFVIDDVFMNIDGFGTVWGVVGQSVVVVEMPFLILFLESCYIFSYFIGDSKDAGEFGYVMTVMDVIYWF